MGFRRTPDEIALTRQTLSAVEFVDGESLSVDFLTRPEIVRAILPAELEPGRRPRVSVQVGRWRSNCVGDFDSAAVVLSARHGDVVGDYVVTMFMSSDVPLLFGRDLFGEPKKLGTLDLERTDSRMSAGLARGGTRLIEIEAELLDDSGPTSRVGRNFNVAYRLAPDASALVGRPTLMTTEFDQTMTVVRPAAATLRLGGTVHDPLDDLEIVEVLGAVYVETGMRVTCSPVGPMDAEAFLPLALGRSDFWPALSTARLPRTHSDHREL